MQIKIYRVYDPPKEKKGMWVLVDRLWPRGIKKEAIPFDLWAKDIAPSTDLRKWFHKDPSSNWDEFKERYLEELKAKKDLVKQILNEAKKGPLTLFYASKDEQHNHAIVLKDFFSSNFVGIRQP